MLKKTYRLPIQDFLSKKEGYSYKCPFFGIKTFSSPFSYSRFGIIIGKKVEKRAVYRNKIKRSIFKIIRVSGYQNNPGKDVLIITFPGIEGLDKEKSKEEIKKGMEKILKR